MRAKKHSKDLFQEAISRLELSLWHSLHTKKFGLDQQINPHLTKLVLFLIGMIPYSVQLSWHLINS